VDDDALYDYYASPTCHLAELTFPPLPPLRNDLYCVGWGVKLNSNQTRLYPDNAGTRFSDPGWMPALYDYYESLMLLAAGLPRTFKTILIVLYPTVPTVRDKNKKKQR